MCNLDASTGTGDPPPPRSDGKSPVGAAGPDGPVSGLPLTPAGFSGLYQQHHRSLWCIAAAIVKDRELAYDVVQEAAVIALGKLSDFNPNTSFPAWCGQIVRFVALNHRKKFNRSPARSADPTVLAATAASGGPAAAIQMGLSPALSEALEELDETACACLLMKTVMDMSYAQIAAALGVPEGTAMSHVHRSRTALRRHLTAGAPGKGVAS